jgi:glycosyltransferase involved in cell wall biosynthesis
MKIIYPYNEILPKKTAHDVYIFQNCASLAHFGCDVQLLCGAGSWDNQALFAHYLSGALQPPSSLAIQRLFILRKNFLGLSWNLPFYLRCQQWIQKKKPDLVITSVIKQAAYHHRRKVPGVRYVYEAHQLAWYPSLSQEQVHDAWLFEKQALEQADLVTVTTSAMKEILLAPPYSLTNCVEVVPLAVNRHPLPSKSLSPGKPLTLMYIGQLYRGQGIDLLLNALQEVPQIQLEIVGGSDDDIARYKQIASSLGIGDRVFFHGFHAPASVAKIAASADAFVTTFGTEGRMPYVAHTKLLEYIAWRRPVIAPNLPIVREHFPDDKGVKLFEPNDLFSLRQALCDLCESGVGEVVERDVSWEARTRLYHTLLSI